MPQESDNGVVTSCFPSAVVRWVTAGLHTVADGTSLDSTAPRNLFCLVERDLLHKEPPQRPRFPEHRVICDFKTWLSSYIKCRFPLCLQYIFWIATIDLQCSTAGTSRIWSWFGQTTSKNVLAINMFNEIRKLAGGSSSCHRPCSISDFNLLHGVFASCQWWGKAGLAQGLSSAASAQSQLTLDSIS